MRQRDRTADRYFGPFGGRYVPETLIHALEELEDAYERYRDDAGFVAELEGLQRDFVGRATPLMLAERLTRRWGLVHLIGGWHRMHDVPVHEGTEEPLHSAFKSGSVSPRFAHSP